MSATAAKPMLDRKAAEQLNLNVLKRLDPDTEELLATAGHVALYDFDVANTRWSRKDVEGSLFVIKRRGSPRFRFIILNKKSAENYIEDIGGAFQCELNEPYLLYRSKAGEVVGIWFFEQEDCARIATLLQRIASTFAAPEDETLETNNSSINDGGASRNTHAAAAAGGGGGGGIAEHYVDIQGGEESEEEEEEDGVFWDKRVTVPKEVPAPGAVAAAIAAQPSAAAENALARVFAGMKVAPSAVSAAAPAPAPAPSQVPLLTPQFLQQQSSGGAPEPQPQPVAMSGGQGAVQGAALLRSLQGAGAAAKTATTNTNNVADASVASVDNDGASKVSQLLRSLAGNSNFCGELAAEMRRAGFLV